MTAPILELERETIVRLQKDYDNLKSQHDNLKSRHDELISKYEALKAKFEKQELAIQSSSKELI